MCTPKPPKTITPSTEGVIHPNARLANNNTFDPNKSKGVGLADNSQKTSFSDFKFGGNTNKVGAGG